MREIYIDIDRLKKYIYTNYNIMSKNSELKAKFRKLTEWKKNFRKHMAELYDNKDAITGKKPLRKSAL